MRDYDPTTGRYMQADPLGLVDGASVYGYARQNPGRYTDPRGEFAGAIGCVGGLIGCAIGIGGSIAIGVLGTLGGIGGVVEDSPTVGDDVLAETGEICEDCPPCTPYTKGTILYRFDTGHRHYPAGDPHLNLLEVVQDPNSCKCYYNRNTPFGQAIDPPAPPSWIEYFGNYAPPLSP